MNESYEWVEIVEPARREHMFANLKTGQCLWDPPHGVNVKPTHANQWWELYDTNTRRYYYYNATSQKTVWRKPRDGDIIPLAKLQMLKAKESHRKTQSPTGKLRGDSVLKEEILYQNISNIQPDIKSDNFFQNTNIKQTLSKSDGNITQSSSDKVNFDTNRNSLNESLQGETEIQPALHRKISTGVENLACKDIGENSDFDKGYDNKLIKDLKKKKLSWENISSITEEIKEEENESETMNIVTVESTKSNTLPRTNLAPDNDKTRFGSLRGKAPAKPPRASAEVNQKQPNNYVNVVIGKGEDKNDNKENYNVTVERSPVLQRKTVERPARPKPPVLKMPNNTSKQSKGDSPSAIISPKPAPLPRPRPVLDTSKEGNKCIVVKKTEKSTVNNYENCEIIKTKEDKTYEKNDKEEDSGRSPSSDYANYETIKKQNESKLVRESNVKENDQVTYGLPSSQPPGIQPVSSIDKGTDLEIKKQVGEVAMETQNVPEAPPVPNVPSIPVVQRRIPPARQNETSLSLYDNVTRSLYDNMTDESDDMAEDSAFGYMSTSPSRSIDLSGSSDEALTPSGTLIRNENIDNGSTFYERLKEREEFDSSSASNTPINSPRSSSTLPSRGSREDAQRTPPKRSPLVRMKSDSSDIEKRAKFSKDIGSSNFRPVSMLNLSSFGPNKPKRLHTGSESEIVEHVPLSTHRRGFLRKRISIHDMLSWSKVPIKKPMVLTREKQLRKDAVDMFKLILQYMGDKRTTKSLDTLAADITTKGWSTPLLRDEIYIQLCKQTTGNERESSLKRGWELMTACLSFFPPSNKFQSYLEGYISRSIDTQEVDIPYEIEMYAKHCHKQLDRICQTGAKRGLKGPSVEEIHSSLKRVFNPSMFGNTLEDIMELQQNLYPDNRLPWILTSLTEAILLQNGLQTEGIFRIPGDIDEVNSLKVSVDRYESPSSLKEPYVPASLLKLWFRDLYEPLIPQRFYDQCIHNCQNSTVCLNIVESLPPLNRLVFSYLIRLLQAFKIPENVYYSKMGEDNLAMVWAPNCLRCPSNDPLEILENTRKEMTFLRTVMQNLDTSFLEGVV